MRRMKFLILGIVSITASLNAVGEDSVPGYRATYPENAIGASTLTIVPKECRKGRFSFWDSNLLGNPRIYKSAGFDTCLLAGIRNIKIQLSNKLSPKNNPYAVLGLNTVYDGIPDWSWIAGLSLQGSMKNFSLATNTRYIGSLSGRYSLKKHLGITVGLYAETGFRSTLARPILGVDYERGHWVYEAIFPIKAGVLYTGFSRGLLSVVLRPFYTALKTQKCLSQSPSIVTFRGYGCEIRYDFFPTQGIDVWATIGETIHSSLRIGDKHNHHPQTIGLKRAPYINVGVMISLP